MPLSLVPPESVAELLHFQPALVDSATQGHLENTVTGHINKCGSRATLSCGSLLRGYHTKTGCLYSELHVGRQERPLVGPFLELTKGDFVYLVVAVRGGSGGPLLCVCHPVSGRVMRAIHLVAPVIHMCLVSAEGLGSLAGGCVALATEDRQLLLLDLCLDGARHYSDESRPATLVALEGVFTDELPPVHPAHAAPVHGIVHLCNLDDLAALDNMAVVNGDMEVTCLQWLPQLRCLGIGLGCGIVYLWDVHKSCSTLVTTLQSDLPVVSLALQEPENDPRCCCYLWVAQGSTSAASASTPLTCFSVATMHALSFQKKEPSQDGHHFYKGCVSGRLMFEYQLVPDVVAGVESAVGQSAQDGELLGSRILSFCTVGSPSIACTAGDVALSPTGTTRPGSERVEDLLLISWQLVRGNRVLGTYLSVFDINQWYRAQMPRAFRANSFQLCSFIGVFSLAELVAKCGNHAVLDVRVQPSTVKRFNSPNPMVEQAHFPSSLAFSCICLTAEGTVEASFLGLQRQLLHYINVEGPTCLSNASDLYVRLSVVGLIGDGRYSGGSHLSPAAAQKALLNLALENRMIGFLVACLRGHLSGEPLLPFVLDWAWAKVKEVKRALDNLYMPLFDCSGQDATMIGRRMSTHLEELRILNRLLEHASNMQVDNRDVLCVWREVTGLLTGHLSVLLFLLQSGILPDHRVGNGLAYPYGILSTWCQQARTDAGGRLLVDVLMEAVLENSDDANPSGPLRGPYPPHSLQRATDLYLLRGLEPWMPHVVTYYLLLDISSVIVLEYQEVKEELEDFPAMFNLGTDLLSIVQGIWYLDHGRHKEGTEKLLHAHSVATLSMRPLLGTLWAPVVRHLLRCGQAPLALRLLDHLKAVSTSEQMALQLDTLLANRRVVDALELVRRHSHLSSLDQLLGCIVAMARKAPSLEARTLFQEFLRVPLSAAEEEQLINFFCELADPTWMCHLILHFLECKRPHAAVRLTAGLRELFREGKAHRTYSSDVREQAFATLELVQGFMRLVPLPASQLNAAARRRSQSGNPVQHLGTLATRVPHKGTTPRLVTRVSALRATMDPAEASKAPKLPLPPIRLAASESRTHTPTSRGRRSSLHSGLEVEALSMLRTPPVKLWQGTTESTPSAAQPSTSTPTSILKRRAVDLPPVTTTPVVRGNAPERDLGTCPTPVELDEDVCPTPEPLVRRLRFAVSDSFSSEHSHNLDATAGSVEAESSLASQSEQQSSTEDQTSSPKMEADLSSDHSSQFHTASESESEESVTDLQDNPLEPVAASTPKCPPTSQPEATTDLHADGGKAPVLDASPTAGSSPPGHKGLLPAFLIQETARRLHGPAGHDTTLAGAPRPADAAAPSQMAAAALPSSPAKSDTAAGEEDLDGTPLADDDEDFVLGDKNEPHLPPGSTDLGKGPSFLLKGAAAPQAPGGLPDKVKMSTGPVEATPLQDDDGTELAEEASEPYSEGSAMSLPVPKFAAAERHATRTEVRVVEEVVATTSSESEASRSCSERSAMSLRLPAFAASEGHVAKAEDARAVEEVIWISASEASEVEQEDEDILILSDTSSVTLPEVLPTRVESPEDSWSRSSGGIATEEGDVVLTELTDVPPAQLAEPLEMAREPSVGLVTAALDVEDIQVEQSLPGYAVCPSEEERSLPKPEDHLQPPNTPATPAQPEGRAVGESYGFVPAVDSPPFVGSAHDSGAALPAQGASSPSMTKSSSPVFTPLRQPSLQEAATGKDAERGAEFSEKPVSPVASLQHSPPKGGQHETELKSSAEVAAKTPEHETELGESLLKTVVTSSYNLREKRTPTWKEEELKTSVARPSRSRRKSGSMTPSQQVPTTPTRSGSSHDLEKSPETAVTPNRKTRATSEEPSTERSRKKSRALEGSPGRKREKASSVTPDRKERASSEEPSTEHSRRKSRALEGSPGRTSPVTVATSSYNLREKQRPTWKEEEQKASVASPSRSRRKSGSVVPSQQLPTTPTRSGRSHDLNKSPETTGTPNRKTRAASEEPSTAHSRKKSRALEGSPGRTREKASLVSPKRTTQSPKQKTQTPSPKAKSTAKATSATAGKPSKRLATPRPSRTSATPSSKRAGASRHVEKQEASPSPTRQSSASPPETPPRRARKSATPSPTRQSTRQQSTTRSPKSKSAVRNPQAKTAEAPTPVKVSLRTRGHTETKTPSNMEKTPEKAVHSIRASSTRQRRSATLSPQEKAARTPSPAKGSPVRSPERAKTSSPVEASARKTRLRHHSSSSADIGRGSSPVPGPSKTETPSKRTSSKRTPRRSSSADVAEGLLQTPTRRGLRLTPDRQLAPKGHVETKPSGARRHPLDTIAEVDTSPTKSDTETSPTVPPTRKGRRNLSTEPDQSVPPKKLLVATRRSRRVSGNVALDTIAEIPDAEMEQEPQPTTSTSQRRLRTKRKADTALDAEGFKLSKPTELARKDSNSTPPKGEFLFSPPVTRHRQQQMSKSSGKPADAEPVPSTSKEQAPKKHDGLPRPLAGSSSDASK